MQGFIDVMKYIYHRNIVTGVSQCFCMLKSNRDSMQKQNQSLISSMVPV